MEIITLLLFVISHLQTPRGEIPSFYTTTQDKQNKLIQKDMNTRDFYSLVKRQRALTFEYNKTKNQDVLKEWQNNGRMIDAELKRIDEALQKKGEQAL